MCQMVNVIEYDFKHYKDAKLEKMKRGNNGSLFTRTRYNIHLVSAFDIETTRLRFQGNNLITESRFNRMSKKMKDTIQTQAIMYVWQWQVDEFVTVYGRTWEEFIDFVDHIQKIMGTNKRCVVYVHNLAYEFQFLKGIYNFQANEVFATDKRRILKCTMFNGAIEFRCSFAHSNMSLAEFCKKMGVEHGKAVGKLDYNKRRFSDTHLTVDELEYCQNDVLGLVEAIKAEMKLDGDNLASIPMTSTGYVRRDCKAAMRKHRFLIQDIFPEPEIYKLLREAFRGGDTHANRFYAGKTLENVRSIDKSSSYPSAMALMEFPISKFFHCQQKVTAAELKELIFVRHKAVIFKAAISNLKLKDRFFGAPYLSSDKCEHIINGKYDNGRILEAEYFETTLTDIDFKIILKEYDFTDIVVLDCAHARYGKLSQSLIDVILEYYEKKTELKDIDEYEVLYNKVKNKINAIYGMSAQDPVIRRLFYDDFELKADETQTDEELLEKYKKNAFIVYQWGVWVTAHARYALRQGIWIVGHNFVYCDTDSVKYIEEYEGQFAEEIKNLNADLVDAALEVGAYADDKNGKTHFMGVYENDGFYSKFKTLGAKKYIFEKAKEPGTIYATIAGVTKALAGEELSKYNGFDSFKEGFVFREAGGNDIIYNDLRTPVRVKIKCKETAYKVRELEITSNAAIVPSTYKIHMTPEYSDLLEESAKLLTTIDFYNKIKR